MSNKIIKVFLLVLLALYVVFPDPIPGPVDDVILCILYALSARKQLPEQGVNQT